MDVQYDSIGGHYQSVKDLPTGLPELTSVRAAVGDVHGADVLDLACGTGFYTRKVAEWGAARVVGVDISREMIEAARDAGGVHETIEYHVADCAAGLRFGRFDVVLGVWLLNYAASEDEMTAMWRGVANNLAPDGRFVTVTQNPWYSFAGAPSTPYGFTFDLLEHVEHGRRVHVTAHTDPVVEFDTHIPNPDVYRRAAVAAHMTEPEWVPLTVHTDWPDGFWDGFVTNPFIALCTSRPA